MFADFAAFLELCEFLEEYELCIRTNHSWFTIALVTFFSSVFKEMKKSNRHSKFYHPYWNVNQVFLTINKWAQFKNVTVSNETRYVKKKQERVENWY